MFVKGIWGGLVLTWCGLRRILSSVIYMFILVHSRFFTGRSGMEDGCVPDDVVRGFIDAANARDEKSVISSRHMSNLGPYTDQNTRCCVKCGVTEWGPDDVCVAEKT